MIDIIGGDYSNLSDFKTNNLNKIYIWNLYYDTQTRGCKITGLPLSFPAFVNTSEVKFNFQTQNKPYAVIQDIPQYVSAINRTYNLSFDVVATDEESALNNYLKLHSILITLKTNYEKTREVIMTGGEFSSGQAGIVNNFAINNMAINSKPNYRIVLESNPFIYNTSGFKTSQLANEYDILLTSFDYKIDTAAGTIATSFSKINELNETAGLKDTLVPLAYTISIGGLLPPENPNIARTFKLATDKYRKSKDTANNTAKLESNRATILQKLGIKEEEMLTTSEINAIIEKLGDEGSIFLESLNIKINLLISDSMIDSDKISLRNLLSKKAEAK